MAYGVRVREGRPGGQLDPRAGQAVCGCRPGPCRLCRSLAWILWRKLQETQWWGRVSRAGQCLPRVPQVTTQPGRPRTLAPSPHGGRGGTEGAQPAPSCMAALQWLAVGRGGGLAGRPLSSCPGDPATALLTGLRSRSFSCICVRREGGVSAGPGQLSLSWGHAPDGSEGTPRSELFASKPVCVHAARRRHYGGQITAN